MDGRRPTRADEGFSLVEVLLTLALMGIGVVALLTGMVTASVGSADSATTVDERQVLLSTAERILSAPYVGCAGGTNGSAPAPATYQAARTDVLLPTTAGAAPAQPASITRIAYWNGRTYVSGQYDDFVDPAVKRNACFYDSDAAVPSHMQRITLTVGKETLVFVKRQGSGAP